MRAARLQRPASAWTAASNASRLGFLALQLTAGSRSGAGVTPLARASTTQRAWSTWRPCPHEKRTARCLSWSVTWQTPHAMYPMVSSRKARGALPVPGFPYRHPGESSSWCLTVWYPMPTAVHCGSSPSDSLALRSPFFPPSTASSGPSDFRFFATLPVSLPCVMFAPSAPPRPPAC